MKVLLISTNMVTTPYPVYPIGMSLVAAAARHAGHDVELFDLLASGGDLGALVARLDAFRPAVVGISIRNIDSTNSLAVSGYVDAVRPLVATVREHGDATVVLGGSGFSLMPEAILARLGGDYGVVGEGEAQFVELLGRLAAGEPPPAGCLTATERVDPASIPAPLYEPTLLKHYRGRGGIIPVQTKRGCASACVYCTYPLLEGHCVRPRPVAAVVDEIEALVRTQEMDYLFFADSVFNDREGHYLAVLDEMARRGVRVPWTAFLQPDGLTPDAVDRMAATGLAAVELGTDATTDATLAGLGKSFTFADVRRCNDLLQERGIATAHYVMVGGPGETPETLEAGIANLLSLGGKAVIFVFLGIRILPGTALHRRALREGIVTPATDLLDEHYYFAPTIDREHAERRLTETLAGRPNCVFPPDKYNNVLAVLHRLGYSGSLWDMLVDAPAGKAAHARS